MRQYSSKDFGMDVEQVEEVLRNNRGFPLHTFHDPTV